MRTSQFKLLDCTLRDGGYINDWNFGHSVIKSIIRNLVAAQMDYIEIGFLRDCEYDKNRTLFNNVAEAKEVLPKDAQNSKFVLMCLHNKYDISKLEPCDGTIEYIRITFHDYDINEGLQFCQEVMKKGYKVFCNPINIMGYSDKALLEMLERINQMRPYGFSIVDTFGSMMKEDLVRIYGIVEHNLDKSIVVGLHLHENLSLSYSLAQEFCSICSNLRNAVIDASLLGMGRVPGNLCGELIMDFMNRYYEKGYNLDIALDTIEDYIVPFKKVEPWGYSTAYALSAQYNLHRNYGEYLLKTGKLRAKQINQILATVEAEKKTVYDEAYIERLYTWFQNIEVDDSMSREYLQKMIGGRTILLLAPGSSLNEQKAQIEEFISENHPVIFSANFEPEDFSASFRFFSNMKRYEEYMETAVKRKECLITSNLQHSEYKAEHVFAYYPLAYRENQLNDNCAVMLLRLLLQLGHKKVYLAGMDGYKEAGENYSVSYMHSANGKVKEENEKIEASLRQLGEEMELIFLTKTQYKR